MLFVSLLYGNHVFQMTDDTFLFFALAKILFEAHNFQDSMVIKGDHNERCPRVLVRISGDGPSGSKRPTAHAAGRSIYHWIYIGHHDQLPAPF
jgi:hypothetical protein